MWVRTWKTTAQQSFSSSRIQVFIYTAGPSLEAGGYKAPQGPWTHRAHMIGAAQTGNEPGAPGKEEIQGTSCSL